jgi:methyl-accepting chemotaxis protein
MQETLGSSSKLVFDRLDGLMSALQASSTQMADDTKRTSTHIGDLAGSMTATLDTAFKTLARDLQEMVGGLISKSAAYTDGTASQFRMMAETQERSVAKLEEARGILFLAMGTFKETINTATDSYIELKKLVTEMRQVSDSTGVAMQRLRQAQEDVVTLTSSAREGVAELAGGARNLGDAVGKNVDVIKQYERLLDQVDSSLSSILRQLDDRTAKYNAAMGEYVERSLVAFDKQLAKATAQLGNTIEELSDNLDKITAINSPR